jgi:NTE family protein
MKNKVISLGLQGGGSHGAFTWGVLDRLLEDERIDIDGISGASAGAINAVVLAHGLVARGRAGARRALAKFWESVSAAHRTMEPLFFLTRFLSPWQLNPLNVNPLREILAAQVDFERLRADPTIKLFVAATEISSGIPRLFSNQEITLDALLASASLPSLLRPVEVNGKAYWDGGLTANPPIRPLLYECVARDIVLVLLDPAERPGIPTDAEQIHRRLGEMSFSSALFSELQGIALAKQEAERRPLSPGYLEGKLRRLNMHAVCPPDSVSQLSTLTRLDAKAGLLKMLHDAGRTQMDAWLESNFARIGRRSSFSLDAYLPSYRVAA